METPEVARKPKKPLHSVAEVGRGGQRGEAAASDGRGAGACPMGFRGNLFGTDGGGLPGSQRRAGTAAVPSRGCPLAWGSRRGRDRRCWSNHHGDIYPQTEMCSEHLGWLWGCGRTSPGTVTGLGRLGGEMCPRHAVTTRLLP